MTTTHTQTPARPASDPPAASAEAARSRAGYVVVLLDVDGVLAPLTHTDPRDPGSTGSTGSTGAGWWEDAVHTRAAGLPLWYSPSLISRVAARAIPRVRGHRPRDPKRRSPRRKESVRML